MDCEVWSFATSSLLHCFIRWLLSWVCVTFDSGNCLVKPAASRELRHRHFHSLVWGSMTIKYRSTRGKQNGLRFEEVILGGLATDRGLFVPESIPQFTIEEIEKVGNTWNLPLSSWPAYVVIDPSTNICAAILTLQMRGMTYIELSYEVISKFVGPDDIPEANLKDIIHRSFSTFRTPGNVRDRKYWSSCFKSTSIMLPLTNFLSICVRRSDTGREVRWVLGTRIVSRPNIRLQGCRPSILRYQTDETFDVL